MKQTPWPLRLLGIVTILAAVMLGSSGAGRAQSDSHTFPQTGHTVSGVLWQYWQGHGGLPQQGYPISDEIAEKSDLNGQTYTVQYFERAVFEKHPENQPPYDVLLSQLGTYRYKAKYGAAGTPMQTASTTNPRYFPESKHTLGGKFRTYWEQHGGLAQQGYPLSDEFTEVSELNGKSYTVQYFERAVFEKHPENQPPYDVLLSQLGTFQYKAKYQTGTNPTPPPASGGVMNVDALVEPYCGVAGTAFTYSAAGFTPNEALSYWFTTPNGTVIGQARASFQAPDSGAFVQDIPNRREFAPSPGWWAMTWQGDSSKHQAIGYFYIARTAGECGHVAAPKQTGDPRSGGGGQTCDTSGSKDGSASASSVTAGDTIRFTVSGFTPGERFSYWFTDPNGVVAGTPRPGGTIPDSGGGYSDLQTDTSFMPGRWTATFQGVSSGHQSIVYFCIHP